MYEFFEHTADLGMRVEAPELDGLFRDAARGLFAMIVEEPPRRPADEELEVRIDSERLDHLFFDWLNELLYAFETRRLVPREFDVRVVEGRLVGTARGSRLDPQRDRLLREVKAITYHGLRVEREGAGWIAEVIVDI